MATDKQVRLIERLIQKTNAGEVRWEQTGNDDVYQAAFPNYGVRVERVFDKWHNDVEGYTVFVLNSEGTEVDEMSDTTFMEVNFARSPFLQLQDLFMGARRTALGADQALDEILNDLER
jgi:hypothetical protein